MAARLCVLLFCCWSVVWAGELSPDCEKGPSYWCRDLTTASQCRQLEYCRDNVWKGSVGFDCVLCEGSIAVLVEISKNNESEKEAKLILEDACQQLDEFLAAMCTNFVDTNFDAMWDYLQHGTDPYKICIEMGICTNNSHRAPEVEGVLCIVCELVMKELESMLVTNATEAEIEAALEKVCSLLPLTLKSECTNFVTTYGPQIINLILKGTTPSLICTVLGLCFESSTAVVEVEPKGQGLLCIVCQLVMKDLESMLITNATEAEIEAALEKVCSLLLPLTLKSECNSFVTTYGPQIINLILNGTTPTLVCTILGLCFESKTAVLDTKSEVKGQGLLCIVCELAMKELDSLIFTNSTEAEIEAALEKVCSILPSTLKKDCDNFVATYGPEIIKLIVEGASPKVVCTLIGVCLLSQSEPYNDCDICKVVVSVADAYLEDNATEPEVAKVLETVCDIFPITIKAECVVFVGNYTEELVSLLVQDLQPEEVCHKLKLCTSFMVLLHKIEN